MKKTIVMLVVTLLVGSGCSTPKVNLSKHQLSSESKASNTVLLPPIATWKQRKVFMQISNGFETPEKLDLKTSLLYDLQDKGYLVVSNPEEAHFLLQVTVAHMGETDVEQAKFALHQGYGAPASNMLQIVPKRQQPRAPVEKEQRQEKSWFRLGDALSNAQDVITTEQSYAGIFDVQISHRDPNQYWRRYQTRLVGIVKRTNLDYDLAATELLTNASHDIVKIFN